MNAIKLLREMHADTKVRFKIILATLDPQMAAARWTELQPLLDLHEQLEDQLVYTPLFEEMGPGTPLGDWHVQHDADVAVVKQLVQAVNGVDPALPEWRMGIAQVMDVLSKHVNDEEGQIFGRIEQIWGPRRLERVGEQLAKQMQRRPQTQQPKRTAAPARRRK